MRIIYNNCEPPVYKEPLLLSYTPKSAVRLIEVTKRLAQHEMEQYVQEKQVIIETREQITVLEHMLAKTDHAELNKQVLEKMENVSSILRSRFSKKDIEIMSTGWRKN